MAAIRSKNGWLFLDFRYRGMRCRESLRLCDSRDAQREANRIRRAVEAEIRAGAFDYAQRFPASPKLKRLGLSAPRSATLGEFGRQWLDEREPHLSPSTRYWYRCLLDTYVFPHPVAAQAIGDVSEADLSDLVRELAVRKGRSGKPLAARTVNAVLARLRTIFAIARRRKLVADDPSAYIENLREKKPEVDPFDLREARALLDAAQGGDRPYLAVLLFAGLRPNEAFALRWEDVDFARGLILVRRNATRFGFGPPKTRDSVRDVPMLSLVREALCEQRARSELRGELVFPSASGGTFDLADFRKRNWARILRRAAVRRRALYQCRHTFARLLLERGENPQFVARALGHANLQMVIQVYGRWGRSAPESQAITTLDADARGCPKGAQTGGKLREGSGGLREAAQAMVLS